MPYIAFVGIYWAQSTPPPKGQYRKIIFVMFTLANKEGQKPWLRVLAIVFLATKLYHFCHCHLVGQVHTWFKLKTTWIGHQYTFSNQSYKEERRRLRIFYYLQHADKLLLYCLQIYPRPKTFSSVAFFLLLMIFMMIIGDYDKDTRKTNTKSWIYIEKPSTRWIPPLPQFSLL